MKLCKPASGDRGEATAAYAFGVPRKCSKIAPGGNIFFTSALRTNSCIGKKCLNDVQNNKNTNTNFRGGNSPGYMCGRNTALQRRLNALYRRELRSDVFWLCVAYRPNLVLVCMKKAALALLFRIHRSLY